MASLNKQYVWTVTVSYDGQSKTVSYPLTCEFNLHRPNQSVAQYCTLNIYNLSPESRMSEFFRQDLRHPDDVAKIKILEFSVGYEDDVTTLFRGIILEAYSTRRNNDVITTIQAVDQGESGYNRKPISVTFQKGTTFIDAYNYVASQLENIKPFARGTLEGEYKTDTTFYGTPLQILNQITNGHTFVDNSQLLTLNNNECLPTDPILLSSETGLLGVPSVKERWITANCILNPKLRIGQRVEIKTTSLEFYNGIYKIFNITHQGVISAAVGGQRTTSIGLLINNHLPNSNVNITSQTESQGEKVVEGTDVYTPGKEKVQNVYKYIRDNKGAIPYWNINNTVSWSNMIGNNNTPEQRYAQLTPSILSNCIIIADKLDKFIKSSSLNGQKIVIESGWRSIENNRSAGGSPESVHLRGGAIDFRFVNINTQDAYNNVFNPQWDTFTYPYRYGNKYFIHVQNTLGKGGAKRQGVKAY